MASKHSINQAEDKSETAGCSPSNAGETAIDPVLVLTALISVAAMWYDFGLALGIEESELDIIKVNNFLDAEACLRNTISRWLKTCDSPRWEQVVEALCSPLVKQMEVAEKIRNKYCPQYQLPAEDSVHLSPMALRQDSSQSQETSPTGLFPYTLEWKKGKKALRRISAPTDAVVNGAIAYFRGYRSRDIYSFNCQSQEWKRLPDCCVRDTSLVVLPVTDDRFVLCTIGGLKREIDREHKADIYTNALFQLQDETAWIPSSAYPNMPTKRSQVTVVYTDQMLIAAGGRNGTGVTAIVEVLHVNNVNYTWCRVADLPRGVYRASGCVCQQKLFILGGYDMAETGPMPVRTAYEVDLYKLACTVPASSNICKNIMSIPLLNSTFVSVFGFILAFGGTELNGKVLVSSSKVHSYHPLTQGWHLLSNSSLLEKRTFSFSVVFNKGDSIDIIVVGGYITKPDVDCTDSMEIATLTTKYPSIIPTLSDLCDVTFDASAKWFNLGTVLGISVGTLKSISQEKQSSAKCLQNMLSEWLMTEKPTWEKLADALKSKFVGENKLAMKITEKYCSKQTVTAVTEEETAGKETPPIAKDPPILAPNYKYPGVTFYGEPQAKEFSSSGGHLSSDDGIKVDIPARAVPQGSKLVVKAQPCFARSDVFVMPEGIQSASPSYLISCEHTEELNNAITVIIEHHVRVSTREEADSLVFLRADPTPDEKGVYKYQEVDLSEGRSEFTPGDNKGIYSTRSWSRWFKKIGLQIKKWFRRGTTPESPLLDPNQYTVRVYWSNQQTTVFISLFHSHYFKMLDSLMNNMKPDDRKEPLCLLADRNEIEFEVTCDPFWKSVLSQQKMNKVEFDYPAIGNYLDSDLPNTYPPNINCQFSPDRGVDSITCTLKVHGFNMAVAFRRHLQASPPYSSYEHATEHGGRGFPQWSEADSDTQPDHSYAKDQQSTLPTSRPANRTKPSNLTKKKSPKYYCTMKEEDVIYQAESVTNQIDAASGWVRRHLRWDMSYHSKLRIHFLNPEVLEEPGWNCGDHPLNITTILAWAATWNTNAKDYPTLEEAPAEKKDAHIRVKFDNSKSTSSWSKIGKAALRVSNKDEPTMVLNLHELTVPDQKSMVLHEFGHALGLEHEHQRSDFWDILETRKENGEWKFIIGKDRMKSGDNGNCSKACDAVFKSNIDIAADDVTRIEYDPESIMHYWFDVNWLWPQYHDLGVVETDDSLTPKERAVLKGVHTRDYRTGGRQPLNPSQSDYDTLNKAYESQHHRSQFSEKRTQPQRTDTDQLASPSVISSEEDASEHSSDLRHRSNQSMPSTIKAKKLLQFPYTRIKNGHECNHFAFGY